MTVKVQTGKSHTKLADAQIQAVADLFAVLCEPTRLRILQMLQAGPAHVGAIIDELRIKQANASKQLGILYQAGVVGREKYGNQVRYFIRMPVVFELCSVVCQHLGREAQSRAVALAGGA
jgi:DNA-binding transcriptional ArsR family regulator